MQNSLLMRARNGLVAAIWQHLLLLVALFFMTLGVTLCVRSDLGSSVISSAPLAFTIAGEHGLAPALSLGMYTNILNWLLIVGQIIVLRRDFEAVQLFQLVIGFVFGALIDLNMSLTSALECPTLASRALTQAAGCTVMAFGIALEIRCASITMPGEGLPAAISKVRGMAFARVKIYIDIALVAIAVSVGYLFFGKWMWQVVGAGTLFAMIYVGLAVKTMNRYMGWFDRLLGYGPGIERRVYGLARHIFASRN